MNGLRTYLPGLETIAEQFTLRLLKSTQTSSPRNVSRALARSCSRLLLMLVLTVAKAIWSSSAFNSASMRPWPHLTRSSPRGAFFPTAPYHQDRKANKVPLVSQPSNVRNCQIVCFASAVMSGNFLQNGTLLAQKSTHALARFFPNLLFIASLASVRSTTPQIPPALRLVSFALLAASPSTLDVSKTKARRPPSK